MTKQADQKNQPKAPAQDWHPADVVAALRKKGWSLRRLSAHHGYAHNSLAKALHIVWPKAEAAIATALDVSPQDIWPSRYASDVPHRRPWGGRITIKSLATDPAPAKDAF